MAKMANDKQAEHPEHAHPPEGTVSYFFYEFWPIMMFAGFFIMMCSLPMFLSPDFSKVLSLPALGIILAFIGALAVTFMATRWIGVYMFTISLVSFLLTFVVYPESISVFAAYWIALLFVTFVLVGMIFLPQKIQKPKKGK